MPAPCTYPVDLGILIHAIWRSTEADDGEGGDATTTIPGHRRVALVGLVNEVRDLRLRVRMLGDDVDALTREAYTAGYCAGKVEDDCDD